MSNLKKLLCNPPAEIVASNGDPKVQGMFRGAGDALHYLPDSPIRDTFAKRITDCEEVYMNAREYTRNEAIATMKGIFDDMAAIDVRKGKDNIGGKKDFVSKRDLEAALDYVAPKEDPKGKGNL